MSLPSEPEEFDLSIFGDFSEEPIVGLGEPRVSLPVKKTAGRAKRSCVPEGVDDLDKRRRKEPVRFYERERAPRVFYSEDVAEEILSRLENGQTFTGICKLPHMPSSFAVQQWVKDKPEFAARFRESREIGYFYLADEVLAIADDSTNDFILRENESGNTVAVVDKENIARAKLRVETRKWILCKMLPKIYGDKVQHMGENGSAIKLSVESLLSDIGGSSRLPGNQSSSE